MYSEIINQSNALCAYTYAHESNVSKWWNEFTGAKNVSTLFSLERLFE